MSAPRDTPIMLRLTAEEAEQFRRAAEREGLGLGPWLRRLGHQAVKEKQQDKSRIQTYPSH